MKKLYRMLMVGVATFGLAAAAQAHMGEGMGHEGCGPGGHMMMMDPARMQHMFDTRMAALHDSLKLTDQQEPAWKALLDKIRPDMKRQRPDFAAMSKLPTPERMDRMLAFMKERQERMTAHAAAVKEFYAQLTPEQQKAFDANFMRHMGEGGPMHRSGKKAPKAD